MRRNNKIFEICSESFNLLKEWLINKDSIYIFLYLPNNVDEYILSNTKKKELSTNEVNNYKLAVKDIKHLDIEFNNIEVALMENEEFVPTRKKLMI